MRIRWDSPFTIYTWGARCDNCGREEDPECYNMGWSELRTTRGNFDYCGRDCAVEHITTWSWKNKAPEPDKNYLGGCKGYDIRCSANHPEQRRMLLSSKMSPYGWILFECNCGNYRYLKNTQEHRNLAKYSRR